MISIDVNDSESFQEEVKGSREFWGDRKGEFISVEEGVKTLNKVRKQLALIPVKRSLGIDWKELGPDNIGGRTRAVLIDKNNSNKIYAGGVSGGLWFSEDGGQSWNQTNPGDQEEYLTVSCITQDKDGYIYYGTGESTFYGAYGIGTGGFLGNGIYRSKVPSGTEFEHLSATWTLAVDQDFATVNAMAADSLGNIYAATLSKVYVSSDHGTTWSVSSATSGGGIFSVAYDVACTPEGVVYAALGNKIYKSPNGVAGTYVDITYSPISSFTGRVTIAIAPSDPNYVYVCSANSSDDLDAIYQSKDAGSSWKKLIGGGSPVFEPFGPMGGGQGGYNQCISVYPNNPNKIVVAGLEVYTWEEGGNWEKISRWNASWNDHDYVHADCHTIRFDHNNPNLFYLGTDGGIFRTKNNGDIFERLNRGFSVTQFYSVASGPTGDVLGGTQDNSNVFIDGLGNTPESGDLHNSGDGGWTAISQLNEDVLFLESQYGRIRRNNTKGGSYSEFFYHENSVLNDDGSDYDNTWAGFVNPFVLWESKSDDLVPDSVAFLANADYLTGEEIIVNSGINNIEFKHQLIQGVNNGETIAVKNKVQSLYIYPTFQSIWMTREPLDFSKTPTWIDLTKAGLSYNSKIGVTAMAISSDGDDLFYGTSKGKVYRISNLSQVIDDATTSNAVVTQIGSFTNSYFKNPTEAFVTGISIDPKDKDRVLVTVGLFNENTNIYLSTTASTTNDMLSFSSVQGNLPSSPLYSSIIEYYSGAFVVAGEYGVFASKDDGTTWSKEVGVPNVPSVMIRQQVFPTSKNFGQIYVGTHGRGFFSSEHYVGSDEVDYIEKNAQNLKIYPNPVQNEVNIQLTSSEDGLYDYSMYELSGKLMAKGTTQVVNGQLTNSINVIQLPKGHYLFVLKSQKEIYSSRFVK